MSKIIQITDEQCIQKYIDSMIGYTCYVESNGIVCSSNTNTYVFKQSKENAIKFGLQNHVNIEMHKLLTTSQLHCNEISLQNASDYDGGRLEISYGNYQYYTNGFVNFSPEGIVTLHE